MKIAIVFGGKSGEHEVSLISASSVVRNIDPKKHQIFLIGIAKTGAWYLQPESEITRIHSDTNAILTVNSTLQQLAVLPSGASSKAFFLFENQTSFGVDVVFPVLHGTYGEDGTIQGLFEMLDVPYVGAGVTASALAMDKEKTKQIWLHAGLPVVPFVCLRRTERYSENYFEKLVVQIEKDFSFPVFVKPRCAGSSVGAGKVNSAAQLQKAVDEALLWDDKILIEPFVQAREIECAVTGNDEAVVYVPGEINPSHEFYDYDAKYTDPNGAVFKIPAQLSEVQIHDVKNLALHAYKSLDISGFARVDFFIDKITGKIYLNELNTIPGFTSISMFPKMCEASGLHYPQLIETLLDLAIKRHENKGKLKTSRL